jgi:hypothetical protein
MRGTIMKIISSKDNLDRRRMVLIGALCLLIAFIVGTFQIYQQSEEKKNFNFVLNYGVEEEINLILFNYNRKPKNSLNTLRGIFIKDLVLNGKTKTKLALTEAEMKEIENYIAKNNIMDYPNEITFETKNDIGRMKSYLTIYQDGKKKLIEWNSFKNWRDYTEDMKKKVDILNNLETKIIELIENKEEFKRLPSRNGGYL